VTERFAATTLADPLPASRAALGEVFGERYEVLGFLGSGGMGQVYKVRDRHDGSLRALKVLQPSDDASGDRSGRFRREAQILGKIQHSAVPRILDSGFGEGRLFLVTELVDGCDLKVEIHKRGPWPIPDAVALVATGGRRAAARRTRSASCTVTSSPATSCWKRTAPCGCWISGWRAGRGVDMATLTKTGRRSSARRPTCRPSSSRAFRSTSAATSTRSASCSTSC
jgi:hypothetical protein